MKKSIRKSSRRKWVVSGIAFFGSVALLTTGFATWVIGANNTSDNDGTNVRVDTAVRNNVSLQIDLTEKEVYIGENITSADLPFINGKPSEEAEAQKDTDFSVTMNIKLEVGKDAGDFKTINFDFSYGLNDEDTNGTDNNKVTIPDSGLGLTANDWHTAKTYNFLKIKDESKTLTLPTEPNKAVNEITMTQDASGNKTYTATGVTIQIFDWGDFFNYQAPSQYYNGLFEAKTIENTTDDVNAVYNELTALQKAFDQKEIFIKATVQ